MKRLSMRRRDYQMKSFETYLGIYQNILAELKSRAEDDGDDNLFDIHYELESVQVDG